PVAALWSARREEPTQRRFRPACHGASMYQPPCAQPDHVGIVLCQYGAEKRQFQWTISARPCREASCVEPPANRLSHIAADPKPVCCLGGRKDAHATITQVQEALSQPARPRIEGFMPAELHTRPPIIS